MTVAVNGEVHSCSNNQSITTARMTSYDPHRPSFRSSSAGASSGISGTGLGPRSVASSSGATVSGASSLSGSGIGLYGRVPVPVAPYPPAPAGVIVRSSLATALHFANVSGSASVSGDTSNSSMNDMELRRSNAHATFPCNHCNGNRKYRHHCPPFQ